MAWRSLLSCLLLFPAFAVLAAEEAPAAKSSVGQLTQPIGAGDVLQIFVALVFVLVLIGFAAWLLRKFSVTGFGNTGALRLLSSVSVGQRERIVLVQAGETQILLGVAQGSVRTLHVFDKPVMLENAGPQASQRFAERLASALQRGDREEK